MALSGSEVAELAYEVERRRLQPWLDELREVMDTTTAEAQGASDEGLRAHLRVGDTGGLVARFPMPDRSWQEMPLPAVVATDLAAWAPAADHRSVALISRTLDDNYSLSIYTVGTEDGASSVTHTERRVSSGVWAFGNGFIWVRRDASQRPRCVVCWHPGAVRTLFDEPEARRRVFVAGVREGRAIIVSRGSGSSAIFLTDEALTKTVEIVPRSAEDDAMALLVAGGLAVLDRRAQTVTMHLAESAHGIKLPSDFVATDLGEQHGELYVRGRRNHTAAVWLPADGPDAVWSAPEAGVIEISQISDRTIDLAVASMIYSPQTVSVERKTGRSTNAAALPGLISWTEWAVANDGVRIPITLCGRVDRTGPSPVLTMVYGCYGLSLDAMHDPYLEHLMRAGIVIAICHVRGGGDFGPHWHDAARGSTKLKSITDYEACLSTITQLDMADSGRIGALASSAGALIATSAVLRQPGLVSVLQLVHPFLTPERILADTHAPLAASDWMEFGDPTKNRAGVESISPLAMLESSSETGMVTPPLWIRAGSHDDRAPLNEIRLWLDVYANRLRGRQPDRTSDAVLQIGDHGHRGHANADDASEANVVAMAWLKRELLAGPSSPTAVID